MAVLPNLFAALGALTAALVVVLATRLFSPRVGAVAGFATTFYHFLIFLAAVPLTKNLASLLFAAFSLCYVRARRGRAPAATVPDQNA